MPCAGKNFKSLPLVMLMLTVHRTQWLMKLLKKNFNRWLMPLFWKFFFSQNGKKRTNFRSPFFYCGFLLTLWCVLPLFLLLFLLCLCLIFAIKKKRALTPFQILKYTNIKFNHGRYAFHLSADTGTKLQSSPNNFFRVIFFHSFTHNSFFKMCIASRWVNIRHK